VVLARAHRQGEAYPTPARRLENLPVVMRGLCDDVLSGEADAYHTAYVIASLIEVIEPVRAEATQGNRAMSVEVRRSAEHGSDH
jgi:hypothetical protein